MPSHASRRGGGRMTSSLHETGGQCRCQLHFLCQPKSEIRMRAHCHRSAKGRVMDLGDKQKQERLTKTPQRP